MYSRTRRKKRTESMEATAGERDADEEDDDNDSQLLKEKEAHHHHRTDILTITTDPITPPSLSSLAGRNLNEIKREFVFLLSLFLK